VKPKQAKENTKVDHCMRGAHTVA